MRLTTDKVAIVEAASIHEFRQWFPEITQEFFDHFKGTLQKVEITCASKDGPGPEGEDRRIFVLDLGPNGYPAECT